MKIESDPVKIKKLSQAKAGENWGFRSFLKSSEIPEYKIDRSVQKFFNQVSKKIDCSKCYNCCKENKPVLNRDDVKKMSKGLNCSVKDFEKKYLVKNEIGESFVFNRKPCPFFIDETCSIEHYRPEYCLSFPFIYRNGFLKRLISVIHNCSVCPIVYNTFELLKEEIWGMVDSDPETDDDDSDTW